MCKYVFSIGLVILLLAMSGCGAEPEVQLAEISRNTIVYDEIVRLNNCGGKGDTDQVVTREFATTIEFGAGISAGYKAVVEGNISAKYSEYRNISKSVRVVAPPGTNMEFVLRWSDDVRAGNVQVDGKSGTYEVRIPVSVEQISSRDLGCGIVPSQVPPSSGIEIQKVETQATGNGIRKTYNITLGEKEIIVGHADKFQGRSPCVAFLIVGPGNFNFWVESGIWDRWINVSSSMHESLLQEQIDTLTNKYNCTPVTRVRLP